MSTAVALRSADPEVVDAVRSLTAIADLPLTIHPPGGRAPEAALLLDSASEARAGDPPWRGQSRRFAWVSIDPGVATPDGARCLVLPDDSEEVLARVRAANTTRRATVVGVVGSRGGAGASSLAAVLARCAATAGLSVGLVDMDPDGGGLDVLVGLEHESGLRWADLGTDDGGFTPEQLSTSLPTWNGVRLLSHDLRGERSPAVEPVLAGLAQAHDLVVLDLTRASARAVVSSWCDTVLVVATCDVQGAAGAQVLAASLAGMDVRLVVRGPSPGGLLASQVAKSAALPLAVSMPAERSLAAAVERGVAPGEHRRGPLVRAARMLLNDLGLTR